MTSICIYLIQLNKKIPQLTLWVCPRMVRHRSGHFVFLSKVLNGKSVLFSRSEYIPTLPPQR